MSFAVNYHEWILRLFKPYIGSSVVEVGAGTGSFSELLARQNVRSLSLVEPSSEMHAILTARLERLATTARVVTYNSTFRQAAERLTEDRPDTIVYVNVMEHIADDEAELAAVHRALEENGKALIFVPAFNWLYGKLDKEIGHFRRYTKSELEDKCRRANFKVVHSTYFDLLGIAPWWVKYRLLQSTTVSARAVQTYDRYVVPVAERLESVMSVPLGKNVLLVAQKI